MAVDPGHRRESWRAWERTGRDRIMLYALAVGRAQPSSFGAAITTENSGVEQRLSGLILCWPRVVPRPSVPSPDMLVHADQKIVLHKPIPVAGSAPRANGCRRVWDKGSAH